LKQSFLLKRGTQVSREHSTAHYPEQGRGQEDGF
jgi:hypothetical protein